MIKAVTSQKEVERLQMKLQKSLRNALDEKIQARLGYQGGSFVDILNYSSKIDLWYLPLQNNPTRHWNGFGIGKPSESGSNSIHGEINFPKYGLNRKVAGGFAKDENGEIIIFHRGHISLKTGTRRTFFKEHYRGDRVFIFEDDRETEVYLVGHLKSPLLAFEIHNFITEVNRIKWLSKNENFDFLENIKEDYFREESSGTSIVNSLGERYITRTHGIVVNSLANELRFLGLDVYNDKNRDLYIKKENKMKTIFEVKTVLNIQSLASGIGQLFIYSFEKNQNVEKVIVLPEKLTTTFERKLKNIGIRVLYYELSEEGVKYEELHELLNL